MTVVANTLAATPRSYRPRRRMFPVASRPVPSVACSMGETSLKKLTLYLGVLVTVLPVVAGGCVYFKARAGFQKVAVKQQEEILTDQLAQMRASIKRYTIEKGSPPQSLSELVTSNYLSNIPTDPITGKQDWQVQIGSVTRLGIAPRFFGPRHSDLGRWAYDVFLKSEL